MIILNSKKKKKKKENCGNLFYTLNEKSGMSQSNIFSR